MLWFSAFGQCELCQLVLMQFGSMQKHVCVQQLQKMALPQAHPTMLCIHYYMCFWQFTVIQQEQVFRVKTRGATAPTQPNLG